ncbi:MAG: hypothetical protein ACXW4U_13605, partial [Anaerolineales bacterium]
METSSNQSSNLPKIIAVIVAILVCCSCVAIVAAGVLGYRAFNLLPPEISTAISPTEEFTTPVPVPTLERLPIDSIPMETLETLGQTEVPENDPYELACRLMALCNVPTTVPAKPYQPGDQESFWVTNTDTAEN